VQGDDPSPQLIPCAQIETALLRGRRVAERGIEVPLVEQPSSSDPPAGELAGPGEGLDALDVEMKVRGGLVSAQESHSSPIILEKPLIARQVVLHVPLNIFKYLWVGRATARPVAYLTVGANVAQYGSDSTRYGVDGALEYMGAALKAEYIGQHRDGGGLDDRGGTPKAPIGCCRGSSWCSSRRTFAGPRSPTTCALAPRRGRELRVRWGQGAAAGGLCLAKDRGAGDAAGHAHHPGAGQILTARRVVMRV
jgi:hypothetical protein